MDIACERTSNECVFIVEGNRDKATLTCECEDRDNDGTCVDFIDTDGDGTPDTRVDSPANSTLTFSEFPEEENNGPDNLHIFAITYTQYTKNTLLFTRVDIGSSQDSTNPAVETDPVSKRFLVVWEDRRDDVQNTKIYGQLLYTTGVRYGDNFIISYQDADGDRQNDPEIANSKQTAPYVEYDPVNQRFMVVWQDGRNQRVSLENLDIYGQYIDLEGSLRGFNFQITSNTANQLTPTVAYNPEKNEFLAVWKDARNIQTSGSDIYGQRYTLEQPLIEIYDFSGTRKLAPPVINFGVIEVNTSSLGGFSIKNTGASPLKLYCVNFENPVSEFTFEPNLPLELTDCTNSPDSTYIELQPQQTYPIQLKFAPTNVGTFNTTISIISDGGILKVSVFGSSVQEVVSAIQINERDGNNDGQIDLGTVEVGQSTTHIIEVKNTGNVTLEVTLSIGGEYYYFMEPFPIIPTTSGTLTLNPGEVKPVVIRFEPGLDAVPGAYQGKIDIAALPYSVNVSPITLTVIFAKPVPRLDKSVIDFGEVNVNPQNPAQETVTLYNDGNAQLRVLECKTSLPEVFTISCPDTVAPNSSKNITITFTPQDTVTYEATATVKTNVGDLTLNLKGGGAGAKIVVIPQVVNFEFVNIGKKEVIKVVISNEGNRPLEINSITEANTSDQITVNYIGTLPIQIEPETYYTILVEFNPDTEDFFRDLITIQNNSYNAPNLTIPVQGIGISSNVEISTSLIDFGTVQVNSESSRSISIKNTSAKNIKLERIDSPAEPFTITPSFQTPYELKPGEEITVIVTFAPTEVGSFNSLVRFLFDISPNPIEVALKGSATARAQANLLRIKYNNIETDSILIPEPILIGNSEDIKISIENPTSQNIAIENISLTGQGFILLSNPQFIPANDEINIRILFQPKDDRLYTATLQIEDSLGNKYSIKLQGVGTSVKSLTDNVFIIPATAPNLPTNYRDKQAFSIYAETTGQEVTVAIQLAKDISDKVVLKRLVTGEWKQIYPTNETNCITNVSYNRNTKILSFNIKDNSSCDINSNTGVVEDPIAIVTEKQTSEPTQPVTLIDTSPAGGGAGCNSISGNAILILLLLLFGRKPLRRFV